MKMEEDLKSMIKVTLWVVPSMAYARFASAQINPGKGRLIALLPVLCILPFLPFFFSSINLRGLSTTFLACMAPFKLLLLSFGIGPLSPSLPLLSFIATASLPVKLTPPTKAQHSITNNRHVLLGSAFKAVLFAAILPLYSLFSLHSHPHLLLVFYSAIIYLSMEFNLALASTIAGLMGLSLEPHFNAPLLSTSLKDFWGRRWNLTVTNILRPSVYDPVSKIFGKPIGVFATFLVSGIMHELMFYYVTFAAPTGEVLGFFVIHGVCTVLEGALMQRGWWPRAVAVPVAFALLAVTLSWLFFPPLMRDGTDERVMQELMMVLGWWEGAGRCFLDKVESLGMWNLPSKSLE